jgi:hypothetical protein
MGSAPTAWLLAACCALRRSLHPNAASNDVATSHTIAAHDRGRATQLYDPIRAIRQGGPAWHMPCLPDLFTQMPACCCRGGTLVARMLSCRLRHLPGPATAVPPRQPFCTYQAWRARSCSDCSSSGQGGPWPTAAADTDSTRVPAVNQA